MLKTVSSITNAIGALNYKGTWNASTNTPTITSSVGVKGDYYVVSVGGSTTIDGISNWGVGDWITYSGSTWQRVEGGADLNGVNLSVSGTTTLSSLTASENLGLNASKEVVSVTLPAFMAHQSTPQTMSNVTFEKLNFQTKTYDFGNDYDTSTSTFTAPKSGLYQVGAAVAMDVTPSLILLDIYVQGASSKQICLIGNTAGNAATGSGLVFLQSGWSLNIFALVTGTPSTNATARETYFTAYFVRSA
jgi:hypothetical protein